MFFPSISFSWSNFSLPRCNLLQGFWKVHVQSHFAMKNIQMHFIEWAFRMKAQIVTKNRGHEKIKSFDRSVSSLANGYRIPLRPPNRNIEAGHQFLWLSSLGRQHKNNHYTKITLHSHRQNHPISYYFKDFEIHVRSVLGFCSVWCYVRLFIYRFVMFNYHV